MTIMTGAVLPSRKEILIELMDFLKVHKAQFYQPGWTERDRAELMAIMHKGNLAISAEDAPLPSIPSAENVPPNTREM